MFHSIVKSGLSLAFLAAFIGINSGSSASQDAPKKPSLWQQPFTPDSKHLIWYDEYARSTFRVFIDGKPVAEGFHAVMSQVTPSWWDMALDGTLSFLTQDDNSLKRVSITPALDLSIATLLGG